MQPESNSRALWMTVRVFLPSTASLAICVSFGVAMMLLHLLVIGLEQGNVANSFLDGQWSLVYEQYFRNPLNSFLELTTLNSALVVVLWGCIGLTIYTLAERFFKNYAEWRDAERDVQLIAPGKVVRRPLHRPFYAVLAWRVVMTCLFMIWVGIALAMFRQLVTVQNLVFGASSTEYFNAYLFSFALQWAFVGHALVVLLRLVARRARLYGRHSGSDDSGFFQD